MPAIAPEAPISGVAECGALATNASPADDAAGEIEQDEAQRPIASSTSSPNIQRKSMLPSNVEKIGVQKHVGHQRQRKARRRRSRPRPGQRRRDQRVRERAPTAAVHATVSSNEYQPRCASDQAPGDDRPFRQRRGDCRPTAALPLTPPIFDPASGSAPAPTARRARPCRWRSGRRRTDNPIAG